MERELIFEIIQASITNALISLNAKSCLVTCRLDTPGIPNLGIIHDAGYLLCSQALKKRKKKAIVRMGSTRVFNSTKVMVHMDSCSKLFKSLSLSLSRIDGPHG